MEQSAFEAVMIGVNVFIFIIALTAAILLLSTVLNMVNYANNNAIIGMNGSLAEHIGVVYERSYTGTELLTYYRKEKANKDSEYSFRVKLTANSNEYPITSYIENERASNYVHDTFVLNYKEKSNGKYIYVFTLRGE